MTRSCTPLVWRRRLGVRRYFGTGIVVFGLDQSQRAVGGCRAHMKWRERFRLHDVDQSLAHQLENRNERDGNSHPALFGTEQLREFEEAGRRELLQDIAHAL